MAVCTFINIDGLIMDFKFNYINIRFGFLENLFLISFKIVPLKILIKTLFFYLLAIKNFEKIKRNYIFIDVLKH